MNKTTIIFLLLICTAFGTAQAQQSDRKAGEGQSIRHRIFSDYDQAIARIRAEQAAPKPKEAAISSPQSLRQHIFPGGGGAPAGVPRNTAAARKAATAPAATGQLPSNVTAKDAADKAKAESKAAATPADLSAQGKEPPLHFEKPKATTPKN